MIPCLSIWRNIYTKQNEVQVKMTQLTKLLHYMHLMFLHLYRSHNQLDSKQSRKNSSQRYGLITCETTIIPACLYMWINFLSWIISISFISIIPCYYVALRMPISEVHTCWPPKFMCGLLDLSVDHECRGGKECQNQDFEFVHRLVAIWAK